MAPDLEAVEHFLHRIGVRKRHHLAAIHPVRPGLHGSTYEAKQSSQMLRNIEAQQKNGFGLYYSLNEGVEVFKQRGFNGKLLADEIVKIHMLGFDVDWTKGNQSERNIFQERALELLNKSDNPPDVIVNSGGGIQALFILGAPLHVGLSRAKIPTKEEAIDDNVSRYFRDEFTRLYKDIVLELEIVLSPLIAEGAAKIDQLGNIDRVFRLPGTVNYPTEAKIANGATKRMAKVVFDAQTTSDFVLLREKIPSKTVKTERKERAPFVERPDKKWTIYNKARFLCEYIRDHKLVEDNENYTHSLMFPLFGMINHNEITAQQGRDLWMLATSTARSPAHGSWAKKWDSRKIENYTGRDIGSTIHFVRKFGCLLPWSVADEAIAVENEAREIQLESLRNPVTADEDDLLKF